ncbi:SGNH/GDSL hydrolase family protein [Burkholderia multivorans]|uniref:SGNH/GDSL hydrolase family protein n=1 Tax=Burkholderia multivorans TaxID=87883 RepID=UPI00158BA3C5|nr:SGNH/GDSL hydrolase family protein [Burkholderia multivorans]MDN8102567.1 SGNH/GDSL hydrolase family protein [Burkholderia multivorans]
MNTAKLTFSKNAVFTLKRTGQYAAAALAAFALAACGGGGGGSEGGSTTGAAQQNPALQVVAFGDELSDVGTYAPVILSGFGGGRYTTNPGEVWTQKVAEYFGGSLSAAYLGGFGQPLTASTGLGYAQGGARVQDPDGEGHAPAAAVNAAYAQATTVPVTQQVQNYLGVHGSFNANQIVLVNGGTDDILELEPTIQNAVAGDVASGMDETTAVQKEALSTLTPVAQALASTVQQIVTSGAGHVVLVNVADLGQTPLGVQSGTTAQQLLTALASVFNQVLSQTIQSYGLAAGKVIPVDLFSWQDGIIRTYQASGFSVSNTGTACNISSMVANATKAGESDPQLFGSALFCSPQLYTTAGADQTYMFADLTNPSTHLHALFAEYVEQQLASAGVKL